jgi:hypothetical protein
MCEREKSEGYIAVACTSTAVIGTKVFGQMKSSRRNPSGSDSATIVRRRKDV